MKKLLICFTVLFSLFLFTNSVSAYTINDTFNFELPPSKNEFNSATATKGKYLKADGSLQTNSDWYLSDYIPVEPNEQYTISGTTITGGNPISLGFYDSNKNLISTLQHYDYIPPKTITIPENCYYIRDSIYKGDISTYQIEKGTIATDYVKYYDDTQTVFNYNNTRYSYNILFSTYVEGGVLQFVLYSFEKEPYLKKVDDFYELYTNSDSSKWQLTIWTTNHQSWYYNQDSSLSKADYYLSSIKFNTQYSKIISTNFDLKDKDGNVIDFDVQSTSYEFDESINSLNYSKVEFVFDIPNKETIFNFNYDFHSNDNLTTFKSPYFEETYTSCSTDESGFSLCRPFPLTNNFLIEEGTEENGQCHLDEFGLPNCYKPNDYSNNDEINVSNSYVVSNYDMVLNNNILTKMTSSLKLVLDLEFNSNVIVDVSFISSLPFEVVYHERTTVSDYYETVDLTGKYGAVFIPKFDITDETLNIRTLFKGTGNLDIQHRSNLDAVNYKILSAYSMNYCNEFLFNQDMIPYSCNEFNGEFEFYVSNSNLKQALFFINGHYSDDKTMNVDVVYDTRYYDYWVFDTPTSIVSVTNPNTGDNSYISLEEFYNFADVDTGFLTDLVNNFLNFFFEKFPVIKQFKMIISLFTYNEDFDDAPVFTVSLDSIGINQEVQIINFSIFNQYRSTVIFWEMLFITTITIVKVTENIVKAFKD